MRRRWLHDLLLCGALACAGAGALAQETAGADAGVDTAGAVAPKPAAKPGAAAGADAGADAGTDATPEGQPMLETARAAVRATTVWLARGVDSWFGDQPFDAGGGKVSDGQLSVGLFRREGERLDVNVRLHARVRLPNLGDSGFAFLGRDNPREVIADKPGAVARQERLQRETRNDREFLAGIGLALRESIDVRLGLRGGFKPYVQARYHEQWEPDASHLIEFRQTFFLSEEDRAGSTTALSFAHAWSPNLALRWLNAATITQSTGRYDVSSVLGAYRAFGDRQVLSLEMLVSALEGGGVAIEDAGLLLKWEQPFMRHWLVGEVVIGHFWPRPSPALPRTGLWAAGLGVRIGF